MLTEIAYHLGWSDEEIAGWMANRFSAILAERPADVAITVPGGSTPFPILRAMTRHDLDWSRLTFWPGDDRCVPVDHEASNFGQLRDALSSTDATVVQLTEDSQPPHFALAWLGVGPDGHTASLFPNTDPQIDDDRIVRRITPEPLPPEAPYERLTMTMPKFLAAEALVFVLRGEDKFALFKEAAAGENDLPIARLLGAARSTVTCFA